MRRTIAAASVVLAFGCGCGAADEDLATATALTSRSPVAARVNGDAITVAEVEGVLSSTRGDRARALDLVVIRRLAAAEARERHLDTSPELAARLVDLRRDAAAREEALLRDGLFAALRDEAVITEDHLRAHYEKTKVRYTERQLRLRRQSFPSAEAAREADQKLGAAGRLDPAASEEIGPASIAKLPKTVLPEAVRLPAAGERVLVEREGTAALVELVEVIPAAAVPYEEVKEKVEASLRIQRAQEAFTKLLDDLRASAKIEIDEAVLRDDTAWQQGLDSKRAAGGR